MKKFLLVFALILALPSCALCPIEAGETVCSIQNSNTSMPLFQNNNTINSKLNMNNSNGIQNPSRTGGSFSRTQNQEGIRMQGSLGCQFGNCNKEINTPFTPNSY